MKHKCRLFYFVLLGLFTQGCGTVATHTGLTGPAANPSWSVDSPPTGTYRGVKRDTGELVWNSQHFDSGYQFLWGALVACDMPVSAVADTLIWPFDAPKGDSKKPQPTPAAH